MNTDRAKEQIKKEIMEAYTFLREKNHTVPSETLELMKDSALKALEPVNADLADVSKCIYCENTPKKGYAYCDECMQADDYTA